MARLSEQWLMQQIDGTVILFEDHTEREIVRFDPSNAEAVRDAMAIVNESELSAEEARLAHFYAGYFYACAVQGI